MHRIFQDYADAKSPKRSAMDLTRDPIQHRAAANGAKRGTGVNDLYIGRLVWNRLRYIKDPESGKRVSRLNPESEWIKREVPELRIVDDDLWQAAKERQQATSRERDGPNDARPFRLWEQQRPRYLFSGLSKCGCCCGGFSMISSTLLGCSTARNKGMCGNRTNIRRDQLEARVLAALRGKLLDPSLFKILCDEFTREMNRLRIEANAGLT